MSMFGQPKPAASLSSTLLARKGQAKPAMRPQGFGGFGAMPGGHDDLGWNDMGDAHAHSASVPHAPPPAAVPPVLLQREVLREEFAPVPVALSAQAPAVAAESAAPAPDPVIPAAAPRALRPISVATAARFNRETAKKSGRAAFTLRLDQERHLRLRIASALQNVSAQTLVTEALDHLLQALPEVDALIAQLPKRPKC